MSLQVEIEKKLNDKVLSVSFDTEAKTGNHRNPRCVRLWQEHDVKMHCRH